MAGRASVALALREAAAALLTTGGPEAAATAFAALRTAFERAAGGPLLVGDTSQAAGDTAAHAYKAAKRELDAQLDARLTPASLAQLLDYDGVAEAQLILLAAAASAPTHEGDQAAIIGRLQSFFLDAVDGPEALAAVLRAVVRWNQQLQQLPIAGAAPPRAARDNPSTRLLAAFDLLTQLFALPPAADALRRGPCADVAVAAIAAVVSSMRAGADGFEAEADAVGEGAPRASAAGTLATGAAAALSALLAHDDGRALLRSDNDTEARLVAAVAAARARPGGRHLSVWIVVHTAGSHSAAVPPRARRDWRTGRFLPSLVASARSARRT